MKTLTIIFNVALAGIAVCLVMTVFTAIRNHKESEAARPAPTSVPMPATPATR